MAESQSNVNPVYTGSCHCKAVKFTVQLDLAHASPDSGTILSKCNCTICHKAGVLNARPNPTGSLHVVQGKDTLGEYVIGHGTIHHFFCRTCAVRIYQAGSYEYEGKTTEFVSVNVLALDGREDGKPMDDLREVKVGYWDGLSDGWQKGTAEKPFDGGVW